MAPMYSAQKAQGLHVLSVLHFTRQLCAQVARAGGVERADLDLLRPYLGDLVDATDKLTNYERQAVARGEIATDTGAREVADMLEAATAILNQTPEERTVARMSDDDVANAFSVDDDQDETPEPAPKASSPDDMSAFDVD
jgi:hypothetical protein